MENSVAPRILRKKGRVALLLWLRLVALHVALNIESSHFHDTIGSHSDALLEVSGKLARTIVSHLDDTFLAWLNGGLGVFRHGAATGGDGLVDHEGCFANVGERKLAADHRTFVAEGSEVMGNLVELNFGLFLCYSYCKAAYKHEGKKYQFLHIATHCFDDFIE
jgi:hypothetical protein